VWIGEAYTDAVTASGGLPLVVPPGEVDIEGLLAVAHAVVITGGAFDIHPRWYGQQQTGRLDAPDEGRTSTEIGLARACLARGIPILGICGGMQALAVAAGGTLIQDLPPADDTHMGHEQPTDPATPWHPVRIAPPADQWLGAVVDANSTHHQAVDRTGDLVACGWSSDGVVEVVSAPSHPFAVGVQWHPELLIQTVPLHLSIYKMLVHKAREMRR
jgi:putative glutamine amidotransferase